MANLFNQANLNTGAYYYSGRNDTSTNYWTYAFGNAIWFMAQAGTRSNTYEDHPNIACEFWRYSIAQQAWVQIHSINLGKSSDCVYRVRYGGMPHSGTVRADYNGDDAYLFAFKAYTYQGARSQCDDRIYVYEIGADAQYSATVQGRKLFIRNEDIAFKYHRDNSGPNNLPLQDNWLKTDGMRGTPLTFSLTKRLISAKSAIAYS